MYTINKGYMLNREKLYFSGKTIFTTNDVIKIIESSNKDNIRKFLKATQEKGFIIKLSRGIWGLKKYNIYEFATKFQKNSYVSFETVLQENSIIFQDYSNTIFLASNNTLEKQALDIQFSIFKIKDSILYNPLGIIHKDNYMMASPERAVCDKIYLSSGYHFDNLDDIDMKVLQEISMIYNKRTQKEILQLIKNHAQ